MTAQEQLIEQKITKRETILAGASATITLEMPTQAKAQLKGYGYSWFATNTFRLQCGSLSFPKRSDQEGSVVQPVMYGEAYPITTGNITFDITNGDSADHTYDIVFVILCNRIIPIESVGGELIQSVGTSSSIVSTFAITDSTGATIAAVTADGLEVHIDKALPTGANTIGAVTIAALPVAASPSTLLDGKKTTTTSAAEALAASTTCKKIILQIDSASGDVYIGNATSQNTLLVATQSIELEIDNLAKIFVKRKTATNAIINYIGA